jgi:hypothetical protein
METFLSEKQELPWSRRNHESLLDYTARHFRLIKLVGCDVGQAPVAYTVRVSDGARSRCVVAGLPFDGSSRLACLAVTRTAIEALPCQLEQLDQLVLTSLRARIRSGAFTSSGKILSDRRHTAGYNDRTTR